ncbi:hypothetical protein HOT99_gp288 [Caulobacter phage CcrBL10]|uniref:Uncharacterized protein n=1 Tax=Caulobacter phage CcrBL10 TaxID=2283269 RepID=A0A385ECA6_9CAUD|nr:hypothetical protein HOT99_gp288 [Caulobacter phage CcrBL10]AXQ68329.1 hypothetical protein CcrBL10_gp125c [Caulobacter phage CcrBL10]
MTALQNATRIPLLPGETFTLQEQAAIETLAMQFYIADQQGEGNGKGWHSLSIRSKRPWRNLARMALSLDPLPLPEGAANEAR